MAWSLSHGVEAYSHAREELDKLPREVLAVIYAEWRMHQHDEENPSLKKYDRAFAWVSDESNITDEALRDQIWDWSQEQSLSENGGLEMWLCPYGCMNHNVSLGD